MNVVLVGCGAMSKAWLEAARQIAGIAIVGLVDLDADRAQARAREFDLDGVAIGTSLDAVLDQTRPDAVFDVVVPAARRDVALSAFAHDCHLLTEKPLADSSDNARAIVEAARRAGRIHAVVQNRRYVANVRRIRRFLDSGAIGAPTSIHADFFVAPHFGGFREEMRHVLLLDMAIHTFDAARYMVNGEPRERLLPGMGAAQLLVPAGLVGDRHLRARRRQGVHLSRQLVRRRLAHQLGQRLADRRRARQPHLGRLRRVAGRSRRGRCARACSTRPSRSSCRRSIRATASAAISA